MNIQRIVIEQQSLTVFENIFVITSRNIGNESDMVQHELAIFNEVLHQTIAFPDFPFQLTHFILGRNAGIRNGIEILSIEIATDIFQVGFLVSLEISGKPVEFHDNAISISGNSFPDTHTARAMFLMILLTILFNNLVCDNVERSRPATILMHVYFAHRQLLGQFFIFLDELHGIYNKVLREVRISSKTRSRTEVLESICRTVLNDRMTTLRTAIGKNIQNFTFCILGIVCNNCTFPLIAP